MIGWQPIETAPRDGTIIPCCWQGRHEDRRFEADWVALRWKRNPRTNEEYFGDPVESDDYSYVTDQPTHWFDLPKVPE